MPEKACYEMLNSGGHVARIGEMRNTYKILVGKPEGRYHSENWRRWEDDIRMDLWEVGWEGLEWMHLAEGKDQWRAVVNTVMNFRVQ
jgi:hypothetical protein